jgi:hypothetical protein
MDTDPDRQALDADPNPDIEADPTGSGCETGSPQHCSEIYERDTKIIVIGL